MKLATLNDNTVDGALILVSRDMKQALRIDHLATTLQMAIENWDTVSGPIGELYASLNAGQLSDSFAFDPKAVLAPLPRCWQWLDGSMFLSHSYLMQDAYKLEPIADLETIPLIYQGAGDDLRGPHDDIVLPSESHGIDFEGEFAVIVDEVPMGTPADKALDYIRLIMLVNDVSLRILAPREMKTGFGFVQSKPATSFSAVAITPDELGEFWRDGRVNLPLKVSLNDEWFGHPNGGAMHFGFHELIAHAAMTRHLCAGTILGSGTVSNSDRSVGSSCISERRSIDMIEYGEIRTEFMRFGDRVTIHAEMPDGSAPFGNIDQKVIPLIPE